MPERCYADIIVRLPLLVQLGRFPVPYVTFTIAIARHKVAHVRREIKIASVSRHHVAGERFLAIHLEPIDGGKDDDLVVQTLARQPLTVRGERYSRHRVHRRIGYVLHVDRYVPFPHAQTFIVRGRYEASIFVNEGDRIDCTKMAIVLLHDLTSTGVPLKWKEKC